jgi:SAM-dependent methyltransferase
MAKYWSDEKLLELGRSFQGSCVLLAAAELDLFGALADGPQSAHDLASAIQGDLRATQYLADALVALGLLEKIGGLYSAGPDVLRALTPGSSDSILPMLRHQANCLRSWAQLAAVVRSGRRHDRPPSVRGPEADLEAFIEAMHVASRPVAGRVIAALGPPRFRQLLDIGCGPGTWSAALLRAMPQARGTLLDLPEVLPIARRYMEAERLSSRLDFVAGDYLADTPLPAGADLVWVSAIVHQNSRQQNRELFARVHAALEPGGRILIRDIVMDEAHTSPPGGAMFAINMLVNTDSGGTFSLKELKEDLRSAGFVDVTLTRAERDMDSVISATRA